MVLLIKLEDEQMVMLSNGPRSRTLGCNSKATLTLSHHGKYQLLSRSVNRIEVLAQVQDGGDPCEHEDRIELPMPAPLLHSSSWLRGYPK